MVEKLKNKSIPGRKGGKRSGAGRKKGGKNKKTLELKAAEQEMRDRVLAKLHPIIDAQFTLAQGCSYLFKKTQRTTRSGNVIEGEPVLVTDPEEIRAYLNGELEDSDDEYHYITTDKPDNKAIDSLLDRTFGKAVTKVAGTGENDEFTFRIIGAPLGKFKL